MLTRPQGRNQVLAERLQALGLRVLVMPALSIRPLPLPSKPSFAPHNYDVLVFVSGQAASLYLTRLNEYGVSAWPTSVVAASVGQSTAQVLRSGGVPDGLLLYPAEDSGNDSEALWALLQARIGSLRRVLLVRGANGRNWLARRLEQAGVHVDSLELYERVPAHVEHAKLEELAHALTAEDQHQPIVLLTSSESVDAMAQQLGSAGLLMPWLGARFLAIHPRIADRLHSVAAAAGMSALPMVKLSSPNDEAIFQAIVAMASSTERS